MVHLICSVHVAGGVVQCICTCGRGSGPLDMQRTCGVAGGVVHLICSVHVVACAQGEWCTRCGRGSGPLDMQRTCGIGGVVHLICSVHVAEGVVHLICSVHVAGGREWCTQCSAVWQGEWST